MPSSITLHLEGNRGKDHGYYMGSLLQGALMEKVDPSFAEKLHESNIHPYSQSVRLDQDTVIWTVNCLNDESERYIFDMLNDESFDHIMLNHREEELTVVNKEIRRISYRSLVDQYYFDASERIFRLRFTSPTSFKQNGSYCLFPSERLIFQSLMKKFDACSEENSVFSDEVLEHYEKYAKIIGYNLRSTYFHLEGVKIPSFMGTVTIKINGPQQMVNMGRMLAVFGTYSGVGIKCGIGMGALAIEDNRKKMK